ncbi:MAG: hypothetical protein ACOC33_02135 [bacterium]
MSILNEIDSKLDNHDDLIEEIKTMLYSFEDLESWDQFVDNQDLGDCQMIVSFIKKDFPNVKSIFGEIEVDEPYYDEDGEEQNKMTHHWVEIDDKPYEFSKGTLKDHIDFLDIYSVDVEDESRYFKIGEK